MPYDPYNDPHLSEGIRRGKAQMDRERVINEVLYHQLCAEEGDRIHREHAQKRAGQQAERDRVLNGPTVDQKTFVKAFFGAIAGALTGWVTWIILIGTLGIIENPTGLWTRTAWVLIGATLFGLFRFRNNTPRERLKRKEIRVRRQEQLDSY